MSTLEWLRQNRQYLSIRAIAAAAGVECSLLHGAIKGTKKLPDKYIPELTNVINRIRK